MEVSQGTLVGHEGPIDGSLFDCTKHFYNFGNDSAL